jgi:transposase
MRALAAPSIPRERLLRAQLLQLFYSIRSERLLMEQLDYDILFRWFVGLELDEPVWAVTVFSKNRDRLLNQAAAQRFFQLVVEQATPWLSDEHFTVDGTLIEAWAGHKTPSGTRRLSGSGRRARPAVVRSAPTNSTTRRALSPRRGHWASRRT